jgi:hypothetical protein
MPITTTITTDTQANSVTLNIIQTGSILVDSVTYTNSNQNLSFVVNNSTQTMTVQDLLSIMGSYLSFNTGIINAFSPSQSQTQPFSAITVTQSDDGVSQLYWLFQPENHPLLSYTCNYPHGSVTIGKRNQAVTLSYAQWLYLLQNIGGYHQDIINAYKL